MAKPEKIWISVYRLEVQGAEAGERPLDEFIELIEELVGNVPIEHRDSLTIEFCCERDLGCDSEFPTVSVGYSRMETQAEADAREAEAAERHRISIARAIHAARAFLAEHAPDTEQTAIRKDND